MKAFAQALRAQAQALEALAAAIEDGAAHGDDWIDARNAPCGTRRCWSIARRRAARGEDGVSIIGRRCLMTRAALAEELARVSGQRRPPAAASPASGSVRAELLAELRLVKGHNG